MRGGDKKKACEEFMHSAQLGYYNSRFYPKENLTPYALYNTSDENKKTILEALNSVDKDTLLVILLGENSIDKLIEENHKIFQNEFITSFPGKVSVLLIEPYILDQTKPIEVKAIDSRIKDKVISVKGVRAKFPLTPVFGPHKYFETPFPQMSDENKQTTRNVYKWRQPMLFNQTIKNLRNKKAFHPSYMSSLRRIINTNALEILNAFVAFPSPLFIDSRITSICYRSFKYLIDIRAQKGRKTKVIYEYTVPHSGAIMTCDDEYPLFPDPFTKCQKEAMGIKENNAEQKYNLDKYYYRKLGIPINEIFEKVKAEKQDYVKEAIEKMNAWANEELRKYIPAGGKRKTRKNRSRKN